MLRLQQDERLLNAIVAHHKLADPAYSIEKIRDARVQDAGPDRL
jgi:hypothetical protein